MFLFTFVSLGCFAAAYSFGDIKDRPLGNEEEVLMIIYRLLGEPSAARFEIKITKNLDNENREVVKISRQPQFYPVTIEGSSGTAVAFGFHHYLKNHLNCHVSWDGDQLELPPWEDMPVVDYQITIADRNRYYMNVCTFSYSYVWWNWTRWEREIDWMALNGFNLALAFTGTEAVWNEVYLDLGFTPEEIDDHFSGPAFLAWNRMGNIRGGAKLSKSWHQNQVNLQKKILSRMRNLGITPILPAFAGHLPRAITRLYPHANITYASRWNQFPDKYCCPAMVLPSEPLFKKIGSMFVTKLMQMFGTNHVYNCDPFNEMEPTTTDPEVLKGYGKSIYSSMRAVDPAAIWLIQGWMFKHDYQYWTKERAKAFLTSVDAGKMIVLDLQAELKPQYKKFDNFFGQPFIWCMLHNFGGTLGLQGALGRVREGIEEARKSNEKEMVGIGLTMEGIGTNYVVYDFLTELLTLESLGNNDTTRFSRFTNKYARRRYGELNDEAIIAWDHLAESVYSYSGDESLHGQYVFNNRPSLKKNIKYWYDPENVFIAWNSFLRAATTLKKPNGLFIIDLVDVTRQALQLKMDEKYSIIVDAYRNRNLLVITQESAKFLEMLDDMDRILETSEKYLLGVWLENAKSLATTPLERRVYERDARNQITLWGPNGEIRDYANKQWAGVVRHYFKPRWVLFFDYMKEAVRRRSSFDSAKFRKNVFDIEQHFAQAYNLYPTVPTGNATAVSQELYEKWRVRSYLLENPALSYTMMESK